MLELESKVQAYPHSEWVPRAVVGMARLRLPDCGGLPRNLEPRLLNVFYQFPKW